MVSIGCADMETLAEKEFYAAFRNKFAYDLENVNLGGAAVVYLSKIYTKAGDEGMTGLGDGSRVWKDAARVAAYGDVDELNATLGNLLAAVPDVPESSLLQIVQNDLFDVGGDLCVPVQADEKPGACLRIQPSQVERLENAIDRLNQHLEPLTSFILPGGSCAAAWLHQARVVCRRAERSVVTLLQKETINPQALIYLNRLSDLLFVLARFANNHGKNDTLWVPGKSRQQ